MRALSLMAASSCLLLAGPTVSSAQAQASPQTATSSQAPQTATNPPAQANKPQPAGPPAPQSSHYPILLLVEAPDASWELRIGQKGPERLDRKGYPPIPLEPGQVISESTTKDWTYKARDMQTGAALTVNLKRESCATPPAATGATPAN